MDRNPIHKWISFTYRSTKMRNRQKQPIQMEFFMRRNNSEKRLFFYSFDRIWYYIHNIKMNIKEITSLNLVDSTYFSKKTFWLNWLNRKELVIEYMWIDDYNNIWIARHFGFYDFIRWWLWLFDSKQTVNVERYMIQQRVWIVKNHYQNFKSLVVTKWHIFQNRRRPLGELFRIVVFFRFWSMDPRDLSSSWNSLRLEALFLDSFFVLWNTLMFTNGFALNWNCTVADDRNVGV